ncbi:MAG TPA: hypothetical protein VGH19_24250 [Verrucomicrobiae bacterium]
MRKALFKEGIVLVFSMVLCSGCQHPSQPKTASSTAQRTEPEVLNVAAEIAKTRGRRMDEYKLRDIHYDPKTDMWLVRYRHITPGFTAFHIRVNDRTGEGKYLHLE